jgi:hypothetical protein
MKAKMERLLDLHNMALYAVVTEESNRLKTMDWGLDEKAIN